MTIGIAQRIKNGHRYLKTLTGAYERRIEKQDKLLDVSSGWLLGYERYIQNAQILISDYTDTERTYTGNSYKDYGTATNEIADRYTCRADWGVSLTGPIIDIRSALISGDKINVKKIETENKKIDENHVSWLDEILEVNGLNDYRFMEMVTSTDIEGRLLWQLEYDDKHEWTTKNNGSKIGIVRVIPHLYQDDNYTVKAGAYGNAEEIKFSDTNKQSLKEEEFVYRKFGGLMGKLNDPVQKVWRTLTYVETAEKCLRDLRQINHLYAGPRPVFVCDSPEEVKKVLEQLAKNPNWKLGVPFVTTAEFKYVQPDLTHVMAMVKEFYTNVQIVSSIVGIPVHWLALVDLMSNRSTAEDLGDFTELAVSTERQIITSALNELIKKAAIMQAEKSKQTAVDYSVFELSLSVITDEQWRHLKDVYIPAAEKKLLPVKQLLDKIPGIDAVEALKEIKEQNRESAAFMFKEDTASEE
jgi:hypothetical protein